MENDREYIDALGIVGILHNLLSCFQRQCVGGGGLLWQKPVNRLSMSADHVSCFYTIR